MDRPGKPTLILIVGPTAVGKSEFAIRLAERLDGEVVSADSRLFYRGMDVGTAKPTHADRLRVPHHLIDIVDPDQTVSLADFQRLAHEAISDIQRRGRIPLLVGGTGQYVRAVTQGWQPPAVKPDLRLRTVLEDMDRTRPDSLLYRRLTAMDPKAAAKIDPSNIRRTVRALEVILKTGRLFSEQRGYGDSPFQVVAIGLRRPRDELYARLDARIEDMFASGLLDEVRTLLAQGCSPDLPSMSAIGYRECIRVLRGQMQVDEAKAEIRRRTRIFVRRQSNWFKEADPSIKWFDAADASLTEAVEAFVRQAIPS